VPFYLYKAGAHYSYLEKPYEALKCFDRVYKLFPDYEKAPVSLFHIATLYSDQLNDTAKARDLYNVFIEKYPQHKLVGDAKLSIENLGKSLEELVAEWEQKEGGDSLVIR
jgi:TolA-binding protein